MHTALQEYADWFAAGMLRVARSDPCSARLIYHAFPLPGLCQTMVSTVSLLSQRWAPTGGAPCWASSSQPRGILLSRWLGTRVAWHPLAPEPPLPQALGGLYS